MSARSTISVLALEMSRPDSTIVVQTSTSNSLLPEVDDDLLERVLAHLPVRDRDPRLGHQLADPRGGPLDRLDPVVDVEDLALAQQLAADRRRRPACRRTAPTKVSTGCRSSGGVWIVDISRMPVSAISSVRGIGVADIVSTSTLVRSAFRCSLCSTPKRCSSSTIDQAEVLEPRRRGCSSRCVPMTTSTVPSARPSSDRRGLLVGLEARQRRAPSPGSRA